MRVAAWPISGSPNLSGSGTAQPPACWAQKFSKRCARNKHGGRIQDGLLNAHHPRRKVLRSLRRADLGAIRRICFHTHVCVLTLGLPDASRQAVGPDTQAGAAAGSFCPAKQTKAKTAGVAEAHRAREAGKPGPTVRHRGKAAWPHARRTAGTFSPATREAERGRPSGYFHDPLIRCAFRPRRRPRPELSSRLACCNKCLYEALHEKLEIH